MLFLMLRPLCHEEHVTHVVPTLQLLFTYLDMVSMSTLLKTISAINLIRTLYLLSFVSSITKLFYKLCICLYFKA